MKNLKEYIKESILGDWSDVNADEVAENVIKKSINEFLDDNYYYMKPRYYDLVKGDNKYIVNVHQHCTTKNHKIKNLTNGLFEFGKVGGDFYCENCKSLTSLEGAPKEVGGEFSCDNCSSLKSLEGAPEKVSGNFSCDNCSSLKSLEGAPEKVGGYFNCCNCTNLTSLEGAPKEVGRDFYCYDCREFTKEDVEKVSKVNGKIII